MQKLIKKIILFSLIACFPSIAIGVGNLHSAIKKLNFEYIRDLLENGAYVNEKNDRGETPLFFFKNRKNLSNKEKEIATFLVKSGANINAKNNMGKTVLDYNKKLAFLKREKEAPFCLFCLRRCYKGQKNLSCKHTFHENCFKHLQKKEKFPYPKCCVGFHLIR